MFVDPRNRSPQRGDRALSTRFLQIYLLLLIVLFGLWVAYPYVQLALFSATQPLPVTARGSLAPMEETAIQVFKRVAPSVVFVTSVEQLRVNLLGSENATVGMGSGFVWDKAGHIVTNDHMVRGAEQVSVRFAGGDFEPAEVVGTAPDYDIAVLRLIEAHRVYPPVMIGSSHDLQVGQTLFAIGNPYGLSHTLTEGVLSALNRRLPTHDGREIGGVIQTDAAIDPGNSGGPLLDSAGRVVGVNTAIVSGSGAFAGVGFAVPIDEVNRVVSDIVRARKVPRPGIGIAALPEAMAAHLGVDGVPVAEVQPGSPAAKADLKGVDVSESRLGDVIVSANGQRVHSVADLAAVLQEVGVGKEVALVVSRDGKTRKVRVPVVDISHAVDKRP
jgi:2-alkenal reductase